MMKEVTAIIMAAGHGKRMEKITRGKIPKPMIEIDGEPVVSRTVRSVREAGINDVVIVIAEDDDYSLRKLSHISRVVTQNTISFPGTAKAAECGLAITPSTVDRKVMILNGDDSSLLSPITIKQLVNKQQENELDCCTLVVPSQKNGNKERYLGHSRVFFEDYNEVAKYSGVLVARYRWLGEQIPLVTPESNGEYKITQIFGLSRYVSKIEQMVLRDSIQWNDFNCPEDLIVFQNKVRASANK